MCRRHCLFVRTVVGVLRAANVVGFCERELFRPGANEYAPQQGPRRCYGLGPWRSWGRQSRYIGIGDPRHAGPAEEQVRPDSLRGGAPSAPKAVSQTADGRRHAP